MRSPRSFRARSLPKACSRERPPAVRWLETALSPPSKAVHAIVDRPASAETGTRDRGMDDKALDELCKWHDEQAAMLRSEAGNLAAAAVAADMHAKTSAALHEAADRDQAAAIGGGTERVRSACQDVRPQHQQHSGADLLVAGGGSGLVPGLVDSRDAGLAIIRADPQATWLLCWNCSPAPPARTSFGFAAPPLARRQARPRPAPRRRHPARARPIHSDGSLSDHGLPAAQRAIIERHLGAAVELIYQPARPAVTSFLRHNNCLPGTTGSVEYEDWHHHPAPDPWRLAREELTRDADTPLPSADLVGARHIRAPILALCFLGARATGRRRR